MLTPPRQAMRCVASIVLAAALQLCPGMVAPVLAQWSGDPAVNLSIADLTSEQVIPKIAETADGGCYVGWFDLASGNYDVRLQRLDPTGLEQWAHNGILVSAHAQNSWLVDWDLIVAGDDSAVLVFSDARDGSDLDIQAYKVAPDGSMAWGADGVTLSTNADFEPSPRAALSVNDEVVVVWGRSPDVGDGAIMMQRLSSAGAEMLPHGGVEIAGEPGETPGFPVIVQAGVCAGDGAVPGDVDGGGRAGVGDRQEGDVVVAWVRDISTFLSFRHVRAERFDAGGNSVWGAPVPVFDATSVPIAHQPRIMSDCSDGVFVVWHWSDGVLFHSSVQHLDALGAELHAHNGLEVTTTPNRNHLNPTMAYSQDAGLTVYWLEENSNQSLWGVFGQKIVAGARVWGDGGAELMPVDDVFKFSLTSIAHGDGAMVFLVDEPTGQFGRNRVLGMRVDGNGNHVWGGVLELSSLLSGKSRIDATRGGPQAGGLLVWEDDRAGTVDVYGQNVNGDGSLGQPSTGTDDPGVATLRTLARVTQNQPNPFVARTEIAIESLAPVSGAGLEFFDATGHLVARIPFDAPVAGRRVLGWDGRGLTGERLPAGVYFYRLHGASGASAVRRAILAR